MERKVNVIGDLDGRQSIEWMDVVNYLKHYVGEAWCT